MRIPTPSGLRPSLLVLAAAVVLSACDTDGAAPPSTVPPAAVTGDPAYDALLADVGGIEGLADLLGGAPTARLEAVLAAHDIAFERVVVDAPADDASETARLAADGIADCPMYFRAEDRQKWIQLVGAGGSESHYIDAQGRPLSAYKRLPPVTDAARSTSCQTSIGNWATPPADYDGGHLIGSQLGGWGRRANIVPQHYNFNRGNWKRVEDQLALCGGLGSGGRRVLRDPRLPQREHDRHAQPLHEQRQRLGLAVAERVLHQRARRRPRRDGPGDVDEDVAPGAGVPLVLKPVARTPDPRPVALPEGEGTS